MGGMTNPRRTHTLVDSADNVIEDTLKHSLITTDIDHWLIHKGLTWIYSVKAQPDTVGVTIKSLDVGAF